MSEAALPDADAGSIRGRIRDLKEKHHRPGVIAVAATPVWAGHPKFDVDGQSVQVSVAPSVLAIRDAMTRRGDADWTVVLTDRPSTDLPGGVLDHLVTQRLLNLDPFPLLRGAFAAKQQEFGLLRGDTTVARALLRELPEKPTPARAGVLTDDHVFAELARIRFALDPADFTPHHVAVWALDRVATSRFAAWTQTAAPELVEAFTAWLAGRLGELGPVVTAVFTALGPADLVPLGLVAALVAAAEGITDDGKGTEALIGVALGNRKLSPRQLYAWGAVATVAVDAAENQDDLAAALARSEELVAATQAAEFIERSDVLPKSLDLRIRTFAESLVVAVDKISDAAALAAVANAWESVRAHRDGSIDDQNAPNDVRVGAAALRLLRRLSMPWPSPTDLTGWLGEYRRDLSWVDGVVDTAFVGASDPILASAAHRLITAARTERARLDREFASLLAAAGTHRETGAGVPRYIEDVLDTVVKPLTVPPSGATFGGVGSFGNGPKQSPVLLVVADGMDVSSSNTIVADARRHRRSQWQDCVFSIDEDASPLTALAVLPTVTTYSRCSLLTGALASGGQDRERAGFADWLQQNGLRGNGQVLFHKADLEAVAKGHSLAADVRAAVQDTVGRAVIACVLNDIDDALDRSDPIGAEWTLSSFKRLDALLAEAATVGRTVVLVSDHGHVVERREQPSVKRGESLSARYRSVSQPAAGDEVHVMGPRVLADGNTAVLAVDEQLRYTGLKAGYHGGASLSEAVIPVSILVSGSIPTHLSLVPSSLEPPTWWSLDTASGPSDLRAAAAVAPRTAVKPVVKAAPKKSTPAQDSLFDFGADAADTTVAAAEIGEVLDPVAQLLASDLFKDQFKTFGRRLRATDIGAVLREAMASNGIIAAARVAELCGLKPTQGRSAVSWLTQILNVDGVIAVALEGDEAVIATSLLFEQYGVS